MSAPELIPQKSKPASPLHVAAQERHFIQRARERFGVRLNHRQYLYWIRKVEEVHRGTRLVGPSDVPGRSLWIIRSGGLTLQVIYDEKTQRLVTCFPLDGQLAAVGRKKVLRLQRKARRKDRDREQKRRRMIREKKWS